MKNRWQTEENVGASQNKMAFRFSLKSFIFYILLFVAIIYITYNFTWKVNGRFNWKDQSNTDELFCHDITGEDSLPDISDNPPETEHRNIFFLETSCNSYKMDKLYLKARQACAVESAARMNPNTNVYLLFASSGVIKDENSQSDRILRMLEKYQNIKLMHFDVNRYIKGSPVESLWTSRLVKTSVYPMAHTSDIFRLLTLWKFGGIYIDLDTIVIKSLEGFPENFAGAESDSIIANGVMGFSKTGKGQEYINECINDVREHFNGKDWSFNGPKLITRNIFSHCPQFDHEMLVRFGSCEEFIIFPPSAFYLIPWEKWEWFFNENLTEIIDSYVEKRSHLIHVWNKLSVNKKIPKNNLNVPYLHLASKYCPGVVRELDQYF